MNTQEKFGVAVRRLRLAKGLTQLQLAYDAQIDRRYMSDIENGKRNVSLAVIGRLAEVFGITLHELFLEMESVR